MNIKFAFLVAMTNIDVSRCGCLEEPFFYANIQI